MLVKSKRLRKNSSTTRQHTEASERLAPSLPQFDQYSNTGQMLVKSKRLPLRENLLITGAA